MKKTIYILASMVLILGITSCNDVAPSDDDGEEICTFAYDSSTTTFEWTAFKTSDRVGVAGGFNEIETYSEELEDPIAVLESTTFSIKASSVETNNEDRNKKINEHFFGTISTTSIDGKIKSVKDNGKAVIEVTMNGITFDVEGDYTLTDGAFNYTSMIDVSAWNAVPGIDALNTICEDLHTGADGVSKLWTEVDLKFSTTLKSTCK